MTRCGCQRSYGDRYRSRKYHNGYYGYPVENGTSGYEKYFYGDECYSRYGPSGIPPRSVAFSNRSAGPNYGRGCGYCNNNYGKSYFRSNYYGYGYGCGAFGTGYDCGKRRVEVVNGTPQLPNYVYN